MELLLRYTEQIYNLVSIYTTKKNIYINIKSHNSTLNFLTLIIIIIITNKWNSFIGYIILLCMLGNLTKNNFTDQKLLPTTP